MHLASATYRVDTTVVSIFQLHYIELVQIFKFVEIRPPKSTNYRLVLFIEELPVNPKVVIYNNNRNQIRGSGFLREFLRK